MGLWAYETVMTKRLRLALRHVLQASVPRKFVYGSAVMLALFVSLWLNAPQPSVSHHTGSHEEPPPRAFEQPDPVPPSEETTTGSNTSVSVNGQAIVVPQNGSTHHRVSGGTNNVEVTTHNQQSSSGHHNSSSTSITINSQSGSNGQANERSGTRR